MPTLREARIERLFSVRALAERAGVAPSTVYMTEAGKYTPRLGTIRRLAEALGVEPREITEFRAALEAALEGKEAA